MIPEKINIEMSESINEIAKALSLAQSEIVGAPKDSTNPHFKSNFASLAAVWSVIRAPLSKNNLAIPQVVVERDGRSYLVTLLVHSSGQWFKSTYPLKPEKDTPQGNGSCLSYARRYCLSAMVGVYQEDDDAEGATNRAGEEHKPSKPLINVSQSNPHASSIKQREFLQRIAKESNWSIEDIKSYMLDTYNVHASVDLTSSQCSDFINYVKNNPIIDLSSKNFDELDVPHFTN